MDHELDPSGRKNIKMRNRHELAPRQKFTADKARAWIKESGWHLTEGFGERHVASEAGSRHPHPGFAQIVVTAIRGALAPHVKVLGIRCFWPYCLCNVKV